MADRTTVLIAAVIIVPIVILLIYAAFRSFIASAKNLKVDPAAVMAEFQAQAKRSDDAHKARVRAHVDRKVPPISDDGRKIIERARRAWLAMKDRYVLLFQLGPDKALDWTRGDGAASVLDYA